MGSANAIARLLGRPAPSKKPEAELWMGAHRRAPSKILKNAIWTNLEYWWGRNITPLIDNNGQCWRNLATAFANTVLARYLTTPLDEWIAADAPTILGPDGHQYQWRLPFLFKVLAADRPLSIQAHPNRQQAREGFARENAAGVPIDAEHRNYKDANHKPEIICALSDFYALNGFRPIGEIAAILAPEPLPAHL